MKRIVSLFAITILVCTMVAPMVSNQSISKNKQITEISARPDNPFISSQIERDVRVALYSELNSTKPSYISIADQANYSAMYTVLQNLGFSITLVDNDDILNHELQPSAYDVFVIPDVLPRENTVNLVKEYWLGGGSILSVDSVIGYLVYSGIISDTYVGDELYDDVWTYISQPLHVIDELHPVTQSYAVNDQINTTSGGGISWGAFNTTVLNALLNHADFTYLGSPLSTVDWVSILAMDPLNRGGGRVVQIPGDMEIFPGDMTELVEDSINWLCPRPKARIAFDYTHQPRLGIDDWDDEFTTFPGFYEPLRDTLVALDYTVEKLYPSSSGNLTLNRLEVFDLIIEICPDLNYTASERTAVEDYVNDGGSLWVLGESNIFSSFIIPHDQLNQLLSFTDIQIASDIDVSGTHQVNITPHLATENAVTVEFATFGYLNLTGTAEPLATLNGSAVYAAQEIGNGRIIVGADMNWVDDVRLTTVNNIHLAIESVGWLTAADANILVFTNYAVPNYYTSYCVRAINEFGVSFELVTTSGAYNLSFQQQDWDLVIVEAPNFSLPESILNLTNDYVINGGHLLMSYYNVDSAPEHPLWETLGFAYANDILSSDPLYIWDESHPIFNKPFEFETTTFDELGFFADKGDLLHVIDGVAIAGHSASQQENETTLLIGNNGRTLYNSYLQDYLQGDADDSGYTDAYEIWVNQLAYLMRIHIDSPSDVEFTSGETGNSLIWNPTGNSPGTYSITLNGSSTVDEIWNGGQVEFNLDSLEVGTHIVEITVFDIAGYEATDSVIVVVNPSPTSEFPIDLNTLLIIIAILGVVIIIAIIAKKRK
ncbi:MAG: hypothetical protein GF411_16675 [Candidatus Lokiarchaeota archaeon]|nr:hypothetical protein [Candidatus Lokiarchaeota archaeon]